MSWSVSFKGTREEAQRHVADAYMPGTVKGYILDGLRHYPHDATVFVSGQGHLHTGSDYDVTSASLNVMRVEPEPVVQSPAPGTGPDVV